MNVGLSWCAAARRMSCALCTKAVPWRIFALVLVLTGLHMIST
jgi:hypothetical protein